MKGAMMTPEQRAAAEPAHEAHGGDESPDRDECPVCIEALDFFIRYGEYPVFNVRSLADQVRDRQVELGLGPDLSEWAPGEITEAYGR